MKLTDNRRDPPLGETSGMKQRNDRHRSWRNTEITGM